MIPGQLEEAMKNYRQSKARIAHLQSQLVMLERFLRYCTRNMINDQVSMSQAITGMPHGSGVGDPVGRLAIDIASGKVSDFVKEIQDDIEKTNAELVKLIPRVNVVELVLSALTEKECVLVEKKMIDELSWAEVMHTMSVRFGVQYSKRTLQRDLARAMKKAYEVLK